MEFPQYCERGVIDESTLAPSVVKDENAAIESRRAKANKGLSMFELHPIHPCWVVLKHTQSFIGLGMTALYSSNLIFDNTWSQS